MSDLIERDKVLDQLHLNHKDVIYIDKNECAKRIMAIPSARPKGEWIEQEDDYHHYWECSECGMGVGLDDIRNFCPNCGARMKGADDENHNDEQ